VCDAHLREAIDIWRPWCRLLNECQEVAYSLLTTAYVCKAEGMHEYRGKYTAAASPTDAGSSSSPSAAEETAGETERNTSSVLCRAAGANPCAIAMENLFVTTHANVSAIEQREAEISSALGDDFTDDLIDSIEAVMMEQTDAQNRTKGGGLKGLRWERTQKPPPPPFPPGIRRDSHVDASDFARLSQCMHNADVNAISLDLPMGLRQISGNGSYTSYAELFYDKCGIEYTWAWVWNDLYYYSGFDYAQQKWVEGGVGSAVAIGILCVDIFVLVCLLAWMVRCVRQGCCFWLCMRASALEQTSLTSGGGGGGGGDSSAPAACSSATRMAASDGAKETEMGSMADQSFPTRFNDEPEEPAMRA